MAENTVLCEEDTAKLLRECFAGIKMGASSIDEVLEYVKSSALRARLTRCKDEHVALLGETETSLHMDGEKGKEPSAMAKSMSWFKTNVKLAMHESDATIADLITDGCNMGIKTLHRYLNQYKEADAGARDIAKRLIESEESLAADLRSYL